MVIYDVSVLGPVRLGGGSPLRGRQALLATLLALAAPDVVSQHELVEWVLGRSRRPELEELRVLVSRLRRQLASAGVSAEVLHQSNGYALNAATDVAAFERHVSDGVEVRTTDPLGALASLVTALALWHGEIANGDLDSHPRVARLTERRILALTTRFQLEILLGRHQECLSEMAEACRLFPYDEGLHRETMIALYRSGRQAEALALYQAVRERLATELGVEPGPALRQTEIDVLTQRLPVGAPPTWGAGQSAVTAPPSKVASAVGPRYSNAYVADVETVDALRAALEAESIVSIVGVAGVGKTRAMLQLIPTIAARYPDGVAFCALSAASNGASATRIVARAVGARVPAGSNAADALVAHLHDRSLLLILDTCEHVVDPIASLVSRISSECTDVTVVATSRVRLGIQGERVVGVRPLPTDLAVQLFIARASVAGTSAESESMSAIDELCTGLDGLPLAIELAAAHARTFSSAEMVRLLDRRLALLRTDAAGGNSVEDRNASLVASLEWSFSLLTDIQQRLLRLLGTLRSPIDLAGVEQLGSDLGVDVALTLSDLVEHSLVVCERHGDESRYRLLDSVRAFALHMLETTGERDDARRLHARLVAQRKDLLVSCAVGRSERSSVDRLDELWADLRAAVEWSLDRRAAEDAAALLAGLGVTVILQERTEVSEWVDAALVLPGLLELGRRSDLLAVAAIADWTKGEFASGLAHVDVMFDLLSRTNSTPTTDTFVAELLNAGVRDITTYAEQSHRIADWAGDVGNLLAETWATTAEGMGHAYLGRCAEALEVLAIAEQRAMRIESRSQLALCEFARTIALLDVDPAEALKSADTAMADATAVRATWLHGGTANYRAAALVRADEPATAVAEVRATCARLARVGTIQSVANTVRNAVALLDRLGHPERAAPLIGWLDANPVGIPGTPGMRRHVEEMRQRLAASMPPTRLTSGLAEGGRLSSAEIARAVERALADLP